MSEWKNLSRLLGAAAVVALAVAGLSAKAPAPVDPGQADLPPGAVARLGDVRLSHGGTVGCLTFSPDGKLIASMGQDTVLRLWDVATGREKRHFDFAGDKLSRDVQQLAWSPDGKTIAMTGQDMIIHFLDAEKLKETHALKGQDVRGTGPVFTFAPDSQSVVWWSNDGIIRHYDLDTKKEIRQWPGVRGHIPQFAFAPDGKKLAVVNAAVTTLIDLGAGTEIAQYKADGFTPYSLAFAPDGKTLALGGFKEVRLWDPAAAKDTVPAKGVEHKMPIQWLRYTADGKLLYSACSDGEIKEWDVAAGKEKRSFKLLSEQGTANPASAMAFSPDAKTLAWVAWSNRVRLTNLATGEELHPAEDRPLTGPFAFTPDGKQLATPAADGKLRLWDAANGKLVRRFDGKAENVYFVGFSGDGKKLVSVGQTIVVWDVETGKESKRFQEFRQGTTIAQSADGKILALGEVDLTRGPVPRDCKIHWIDLDPVKEVAQSAAVHKGSVMAMAFAPTGKTMASIGIDNTIRVWEVSSGKQLANVEFGQGHMGKLVYTADGKTLLSAHRFFDGGQTVVRVAERDPDTAKERKTHDFKAPLVGTFSPDGSLIAWPAEGNTVRVAELATDKTVAELKGHQGAVHFMTFSADGKKLASGSADGTILIWDLGRAPKP